MNRIVFDAPISHIDLDGCKLSDIQYILEKNNIKFSLEENHYDKLQKAIDSGDFDYVKSYNKDYSKDYRDFLHRTIKYNHVDIFLHILNLLDYTDHTLMLEACIHGRLEIVKILWERGHNFVKIAYSAKYHDCLDAAAENKHVEIVDFIFEKTPKHPIHYNNHLVCATNDPIILKKLLGENGRGKKRMALLAKECIRKKRFESLYVIDSYNQVNIDELIGRVLNAEDAEFARRLYKLKVMSM